MPESQIRFPRLAGLAACVALALGAEARAVEAEPGCAPIINAMVAEMGASVWHRTATIGTGAGAMKMELLKADGALYRRIRGGPWSRMPMTVAALNQTNGELLKSGKLKVRSCRRVGAEAVDGVPTVAYEYTTEIAGAPKPYVGRLWVGVTDGLPYRITAAETSQTIVYKGVTAPK